VNPASPVHGARIQTAPRHALPVRRAGRSRGHRASDGAKEAIKADLARRSVSEVVLDSERAATNTTARGRLLAFAVSTDMAMTYGRVGPDPEFALEDGTRTAPLHDAGTWSASSHHVEVR